MVYIVPVALNPTPPPKQKAHQEKLQVWKGNFKYQMPSLPGKLGVLFLLMGFVDVCSSNTSHCSFFE